MRSALVLHSVFVMVICASIFFLRAKQARREMDERMAQHPHSIPHPHVETVPMEKMGSSPSTGSMEKAGLVQRDDLIPSLEEGVRVKVDNLAVIALPGS